MSHGREPAACELPGRLINAPRTRVRAARADSSTFRIRRSGPTAPPAWADAAARLVLRMVCSWKGGGRELQLIYAAAEFTLVGDRVGSYAQVWGRVNICCFLLLRALFRVSGSVGFRAVRAPPGVTRAPRPLSAPGVPPGHPGPPFDLRGAPG